MSESPAILSSHADLRAAIVGRADPIVVKVGTNVLTDPTGRIDLARIDALAEQVAQVRHSGKRLVLVTSGAIGAGMGRLGLSRRPVNLPHLQACAAVGQSALIELYERALQKHGLSAAQLLLTAGDFDNRARYLNMRNTLVTLFEYLAIPIINENDTVSVAEIRFGDNDQLAAMVANLLSAPLLVLLTNVDGLLSADPNIDPNAHRLEVVPSIDKSITELAGDTKSRLGSGGMRSKLRAARLATAAGGAVVVANGAGDNTLTSVLKGEAVGTLFLPHGEGMPAWKRWLGYTAQPRGALMLDEGAVRAVVELGRSLLPVGVRSVRGSFNKGDVVSLCTVEGTEVARGLSNYPAVEAVRIAGQGRSSMGDAADRLAYEEIVHRDNLVVLR